MLNKILFNTFDSLGLDERSKWRAVTLTKLLTSHHSWWKIFDIPEAKPKEKFEYKILTNLLSDSDIQLYLGVNRYQDILWFNKESFEDLLWWLYIIAALEVSCQYLKADQTENISRVLLKCYNGISNLISTSEASGYKLEKLLDLVK
jgi:hypothetical protein